MSRTIEAITRHMVPPAQRERVETKRQNVSAEWQSGAKTLSGRRQRKLRLVFAPSPSPAQNNP